MWIIDKPTPNKPVVCLLLTIFFLVIFITGCSKTTVNEKWIGHYSFPGNEIEFPLHVNIQVNGTRVTGIAIDGNMEEATISGSVEDGMYDLLLHPVKHGESKSQDVYYRGRRSGDEIVGEWEHVVGAKGPWVSKLTDLDAEEAIKILTGPCEPDNAANSNSCANDA
jgi:hypothetical protein